MAADPSGHRSVPHTADLQIEAWAPTRDDCIRQAVLGTVESFLDTFGVRLQGTRLRRLTATSDDDLLVAVVDEVIYLLDTAGEAPIDLALQAPFGHDRAASPSAHPQGWTAERYRRDEKSARKVTALNPPRSPKCTLW